MATSSTAHATVAAYLAAQPPAIRATLKRVRAIVKKALPRATERISYGIPTFEVDGAMVLYIAGYRAHWSIYPATPRVVAALGRDAESRVHHKGTVSFALDEVPATLITRIAKARAAEVAGAAKAKQPAAKRAAAKRRKATKPAATKPAAKRRTAKDR